MANKLQSGAVTGVFYFQRNRPPQHHMSKRTPPMIQEPTSVQPYEFAEDEFCQELVNDSMGTMSLADSTGTEFEQRTEEEEELERIAYASDERQD
jgi:hypothetical protein